MLGVRKRVRFICTYFTNVLQYLPESAVARISVVCYVVDIFMQKGVGFLNMDCKICHSALCMAAVFVDAAGEWKIGGVDYLHAIGEAQPEPVLTYLKKYQPPGAKGAETKVQW